MRELLTQLPRYQKRLLSVGFDVLCIWLSFFAAMVLRYGHLQWLNTPEYTWAIFAVIAPLTAVPFFVRMGLYRAVLRYINSVTMAIMVKAVFLSALTLLAVDALLLPDVVLPRSVPFFYFLILSSLMLTSRYFLQHWLIGAPLSVALRQIFDFQQKALSEYGRPVLIVGHGKALFDLVEVLDRTRDYQPQVLVDYSGASVGGEVHGKPVVAMNDLPSALQQFEPDEILLALPDISRSERRRLIQELEQYALPIRTMPSFEDISSGRMSLADVQDVDIADVLGREEVVADSALLAAAVSAKVVLVTGAGGSIGSELVRQIIKLQPAKLILLDHSEFNLYQLDREVQVIVQTLGLQLEVVPVLASVCADAMLERLMQQHGVQTVYHAAAYKHVPMIEANALQGFENNVWGTIACAQAAIKAKVERFVLISTDKAVRPSNIMGASKRLAELALQLFNSSEVPIFKRDFSLQEMLPSSTCFSMVRFGNVLGSSGSVIPLFKEQIRLGGPVTVTHPDIIRYFMSIPEAAQLVIQAGSMAQGGDVFVLDMGEPIKIVDLAKRMISLAGLTLKASGSDDGDIDIVFSGLRPGEKLYEELLIGNKPEKTLHPRIFKAHEAQLDCKAYSDLLQALQQSLTANDLQACKKILANPAVAFNVSLQS